MFLQNPCIRVLWMEIATALEGLNSGQIKYEEAYVALWYYSSLSITKFDPNTLLGNPGIRKSE